jgi:hypothetical protein
MHGGDFELFAGCPHSALGMTHSNNLVASVNRLIRINLRIDDLSETRKKPLNLFTPFVASAPGNLFRLLNFDRGSSSWKTTGMSWRRNAS